MLIIAGCSKYHSEPNVELIQDMMESPAVKAQKGGPQGMRMPPEGTVPQGFDPYPYHNDPFTAEKELKNPVTVSEASLKRGQKLFETYCFVCHGLSGKGDGPVSSKMAVKPPPLISDKVKAFKDGRIFHIITDGQGVMNTYATQINDPDDRWSVVNYVRRLQQGGG